MVLVSRKENDYTQIKINKTVRFECVFKKFSLSVPVPVLRNFLFNQLVLWNTLTFDLSRVYVGLKKVA